MAPRLRPEVIIPLRTGSAWARTLLLSCCAFIMFVTTVDAMRYASQRERVPTRVYEREAAKPKKLCQISGHPAIRIPCDRITSPRPR
ncbi:MAG TPA: hypothetical protein VMZ28_27580 [Kofleriaceae bacterium]|nr:hypothetical protein [Kofleriaceae bacterium]